MWLLVCVCVCLCVCVKAKPEGNHPEVNETLKKLNRHLAQTFARDFPFYLLLAYKMHM